MVLTEQDKLWIKEAFNASRSVTRDERRDEASGVRDELKGEAAMVRDRLVQHDQQPKGGALTEQDIRWIKAIVEKAVADTLLESRNYTDKQVKEHQTSCTYVAQGKGGDRIISFVSSGLGAAVVLAIFKAVFK